MGVSLNQLLLLPCVIHQWNSVFLYGVPDDQVEPPFLNRQSTIISPNSTTAHLNKSA